MMVLARVMKVTGTILGLLIVALLNPKLLCQDLGKFAEQGGVPAHLAASAIRQYGIAYVYSGKADPCKSESGRPAPELLGTGFILSIPSDTEEVKSTQKGFRFLITAKHVVKDLTDVYVRVNDPRNASRSICIPISSLRNEQNMFYPNRQPSDSAAILVNSHLIDGGLVFYPNQILGRKELDQLGLGEGTSVYTVGNVPIGAQPSYNSPISRFGSIARLDKGIVVPGIDSTDAWIADFTATPGISGAPVLLRELQLSYGLRGEVQLRSLPGRIVGLTIASVGFGQQSSALSIVEPGEALLDLIEVLRKFLVSNGHLPTKAK